MDSYPFIREGTNSCAKTSSMGAIATLAYAIAQSTAYNISNQLFVPP